MQNVRQRCKIKVRRFLLISYGVLELWRKTLRGIHPPGPDRVKGTGSKIKATKDHCKKFRSKIAASSSEPTCFFQQCILIYLLATLKFRRREIIGHSSEKQYLLFFAFLSKILWRQNVLGESNRITCGVPSLVESQIISKFS